MRSLHFQSGKHNLDMDGKRRYALSDWWLLGPLRGILFGASLKLVRTAKIHCTQQDIQNMKTSTTRAIRGPVD